MKRERIHYNTVREICFSPEDIARLSDNLQQNGAPCHIRHLMPGEADPVRLAQVKDVIETVLTGRKYESFCCCARRARRLQKSRCF